MRGASVRTLIAFAIGVVVLGIILYVATTVDARPPTVQRIGLTHHLSADASVALTTTSVEVVFSEEVDRRTAEAAFSTQPAIRGAFSWSGATLTFTPNERLPLEATFVVRVAAGVLDPGGNRMSTPAQLAFTTVGHPSVIGSQPQPNAGDVPLDEQIVLRFSTLMDTASVEDALTITPDVELERTWAGEQLTLVPAQPLEEGTRYTIRLEETARDSAGTPLRSPYLLSFQAIRSSLQADIRFPADGTEGISVTTPIAVVFDQPLDPATVDADAFRIQPDVAGSLDVVPLPGAAGMRQPGARVLRFTPFAPLASNTTYRVTVAPGIAAVGGATPASSLTWTFTTGAQIGSLSNQITFLSDRAGIANLWAMNPDGSGLRELSSELTPISSYALAPDGRSFVVGDGAILVRQLADGRGRTLFTGPGVLEVDPAFSPDGTEVAFARMDPATGYGLGLWLRPPAGGQARQIQLPQEIAASPTPSRSPSAAASPAQRQPVLRAPRFSPDGAALAFVDLSGRVGILELPGDRLTTAQFAAVTPPEWLPDSSGILLSGSSGGTLEPPALRQPQPVLDPGTLQLSSFELAGLRLARLDRGANSVRTLDQLPGASRPQPGQLGRYLFISVRSGAPDAAGRLQLSTATDVATPLLEDGGPPVLSAGFGPQARLAVAARSGAGIWIVDFATGGGQQLTQEGWLPRWLP
ncbi:MAG TPA: Ig-like domain-containing protein [Candidatus Limnocylindria bacterium]|nr:Ig-like domain-containing protein [Candidatus Limnocylindria bacterium]